MKGKKIFWGLFFIVAAGLIVVNQLGMFVEIGLLSLVFTVVLAAILIESLFNLSWWGILFSLAFLGIIYAEPLNITNLTPWPILATALLGSIGLSIIFPKHHHTHGYCGKNKCNGFENDKFVAENICGSDNNNIDVNVSFGASAKYINAKDVSNVNVYCNFGAAKIYFDNAELKDNVASLNLDVNFAGVELYIPRTWRIVNNANVSLAGIDEKNSNAGTFDNTLYLTGKLHLSGVEITYI